MATTEAACLDALREAAERLGESPTKAQYEELGLRPASTTILRICGSWNEAKKQAGLKTYSQSENGGIDIQPKPEWVTIPNGEDWDNLTAHSDGTTKTGVTESRPRNDVGDTFENGFPD